MSLCPQELNTPITVTDSTEAARIKELTDRVSSDLTFVVDAADRITQFGAQHAQRAREALSVIRPAGEALVGLTTLWRSSDSTSGSIISSGIANMEAMVSTVSLVRAEVDHALRGVEGQTLSTGSVVIPLQTRAAATFGVSAAAIIKEEVPSHPVLAVADSLRRPLNRDAVAVRLRAVKPDLESILLAIENAVSVKQPDAVRRASEPVRDLVTLLLNEIAPHVDVMKAAWFVKDPTAKECTRAQRVRYAVQGATEEGLDAPFLREVQSLATQINSLYGDLSGTSHVGVGDLTRVESWYHRILEHILTLFELRDVAIQARAVRGGGSNLATLSI